MATELDMPTDKMEERLHNILKDKRITKDKDISDLIELVIDGLPNLRARFEMLLNQVTVLENEKNSLSTEILGLRNSIYANNGIISKQNLQLRKLARKQNQLQVMLRKADKDPNYTTVSEIVDQRLNDRRSLLVAALLAVFKTLKANPYGLSLLSSFPPDIESYLGVNIDGKNLLKFAESCYNSLLKSYTKTIA